MTIDFSSAEYNAIKKIYKDIVIIPCFFHYCQNITQKLPELKSNNNIIKKLAKDLFSNLNLIYFVERDNLKTFYDDILYKFNSKFPKFLKYLI